MNTNIAFLETPVAAPTEERCQVLLVDDEPEVLNTLHRQLRREFDTFLAHSADEALAVIDNRPIHVVISDERMPGTTGSELLKQIKEQNPDIVRLLLTGYADLQAVIQAVNQGRIYRYITKPWDAAEIRAVIRDAHERYRTLAEKRRFLDELRETNDLLDQRVWERTKQLERALLELRDSDRLYRSIVENISDPIMTTDMSGRILSVNPAFTHVLGYNAEDVVGHHPNLLASERHPDEFYDEIWRQLPETGRWRGLVWSRRKDGEMCAQRLTVSVVGEGAGQGLCVAVYNDFTEEMLELEQMRFMVQKLR